MRGTAAGPRVIATAYCCSPADGSEHYAGHHFINEIGRRSQVTVLVPGQLREALKGARHPESVQFEYLPTPMYVPWERAATGDYSSAAISYYLFSLLAYARALRLVKRGQADVAHHITIANYRFPSLLPFVGLPTVLGPLGGGEEIPAGFRTGSAYEAVRRLSVAMATRDPVLRRSVARARHLLVANRETANRVSMGGKPTELMMYGFDADEVGVAEKRARRKSDLTVLCVSRLVRHKGIELLVRAVPRVATEIPGRLRVMIFGDGNEYSRLAALIERTPGAREHVTLEARVDRSTLLRYYGQADLFCFPSLRDTCPVALLEAMAAGLPVIVLDHSGPRAIVTDECGIRVPALDPEGTVAGLAEAICRLAKDSELRVEMGRAARRRIERDFRWSERGDRLSSIYATLLQG